MSPAAWTFWGLVIPAFLGNAVALTALFVRAGRTATEVAQVNRAVNHQPPGAPTLVERVEKLEVHREETHEHWRWERRALAAIARNTGTVLPPHPREEHS